MSDVTTTHVDLDGQRIRVWTKGAGPKVGFLAGWGGLPRWIPFLDALAEQRTVVVPSLPGFPGGGLAHKALDNQIDWIVATRRIVMAAGLDGCDLVGSSVGGALAAEIAALWPRDVRRLALIAPLGFWSGDERSADVFARRADEYPALLCAEPDAYVALKTAPNDADPAEWEIEQARAAEATARMLWPIADTRLAKRLPLIAPKTLLLRGERDQVVGDGYLARMANSIGARARIERIDGAGHLAELDRPRETARAILDFLA